MEKTVAVLFTHRRDTVNKALQIYGDYIKIENKAKFLGIIFDSKLTWSDHVNYIMDKCNKRLNLLRAVSGNKWGASKKTLLILYRSLIRSILDYGDIALDSMSDHNKRKLDSIQARALRWSVELWRVQRHQHYRSTRANCRYSSGDYNTSFNTLLRSNQITIIQQTMSSNQIG